MSPKIRIACRWGVLLVGIASAALAAVDRPSPTIAVRYSFDGWFTGAVADAGDRYPLRRRGTVSFAPRAGGWAARYPARCAGAGCPRGILESDAVAALNPGTRAVRYGASVLMAPADTGDGANVLQKGFSTGGVTQFKLQVDGAAGRPSCVVASKTDIYRVIAPVTVADGRWHALQCARSSTELSISVDGGRQGAVAVPARVSIVNSEPLRIGGKSLSVDNDQYAGLVDDVFVVID
ncbi:LamG-like jellyroll fold domain-containing protein [Actinomycetes bacterium KLBMP 9797]